jgi:UDP-glucose 4-epimerase
MKNVLVTGGAGFIGSHLVDALAAKKCKVKVIDNLSVGRLENLRLSQGTGRVDFVEANVSDHDAIAGHFQGIDTVFHLAALADIVPSIQNPLDYFKANVDGTASVLEACRRHSVSRVVYAASSSCYGIPEQYPTPETSRIRPEYPYALTKYLGEELVMHWAKVYQLSAMCLRFFNVYGPRARTSGTYGAVFGVFLSQKIHGKPLTIVGDGSQTRDFTFVSDVVFALIAAAESRVTGEAVNVGSSRSVSVNAIADLIGGEKTYIPKRPGEPDCTFADISKIRRLLNWQPKVSIEQGVAELVKHIADWEDAPVWTPETIRSATSDWFRYLSPRA